MSHRNDIHRLLKQTEIEFTLAAWSFDDSSRRVANDPLLLPKGTRREMQSHSVGLPSSRFLNGFLADRPEAWEVSQ